jgi:hypothetical protein
MRLPIDTESANFENEKTAQPARTIEIDDASLLVSVQQAASILGIGRTRAFELVMVERSPARRSDVVVWSFADPSRSSSSALLRLKNPQMMTDWREVTCTTGRHPLPAPRPPYFTPLRAK